MDFKRYYSSLSRVEQRNIRDRLCEAFCVNESTVYRWINGEAYPGASKARKIADIISIDEDSLFPETRKKACDGE